MRPFVLVGLFASLLTGATAALAQAPQLMAHDPAKPDERAHPVAISKADIVLQAAGRLCRTTVTLTFHNDADRVLEGDLIFPLPEGATVSGYALDVGGQLVDAVTIEKEKARVVFETETRRGVDPGIVEQVQGNNFRTRVHPIPAKGTRTIRVEYVSQAVEDGQTVSYKLPTQWAPATAELTVAIESISKNPPTVAALPGLAFESQDGHHVARIAPDKAALAKEIVATLPAADLPRVVVERHVKPAVSAENLDAKAAEQFAPAPEYYFVATDLPAPPPATATATRAKPARIAIAWDASLSRGHADHAREFDVIKRHLAAPGDVTVDVTAFRNVPDKTRTFHLKDGDAAELIAYLKGLAYDGGTSLSAVRFAKASADGEAVAYYLLFTDGLSNLGSETPTGAEAPVYAVSDDAGANHGVLRRIAATSGGQYFNLQTTTAQRAAAAIGETPFMLLGVDCDPKEIADVYPRTPQPVQGRVTLAGRLLAPSATMTLKYGRGGEVSLRVPITVTQGGAVASASLVSRYWAQMKLADLSAEGADRNEADVVALGKAFNLVTPFTSMIVLETADQYLRYKIVPPKSRGEIYAQFMRDIEQRTATARREETAKIDRVVAMWDNRLAWWNRDFKYAANFKYREPAKGKADGAVTAYGAIRLGATVDAAGRPEALREQARQAGEPASTATGVPAATPAPVNPARVPAAGQAVTRVDVLAEHTLRGDDATDLRLGRVTGATSAAAQTGRGFSEAGGGARGVSSGGGGGGGFGNFNFDSDGIADREMVLSSERTRGRFAAAGGRPEGQVRDEYRRLSAPATSPAGGQPGETPLAATVADPSLAKAWTPETPYLKALRAAKTGEAYGVYLEQRKSYELLPAFYLDCSDFFAGVDPELSLRILTNVPELGLDDGRLLRIAAHRLQQLKQHDLAIDLFERVVRLRPEEPQSFRDLALALADRADGLAAAGDADRALSDYRRSLELLHKVVMNQWDRFDEIEVIALMEANRLLAKLGTQDSALRTLFDPRLVKLLDPDVRIVMTWDTDNTDIDLHVTEPSGETCVYDHNRTTIGGALSKDFTQGYGPEEYVLRKAMPGQYKIQAHFFGNRDQQFVGPTTVQATIITHFGRADEKREAITLRLKDAKDMVDVGTVTVK